MTYNYKDYWKLNQNKQAMFDGEEDTIMEHLKMFEFDSILELGSGMGRLTQRIRDNFPDVELHTVDLYCPQHKVSDKHFNEDILYWRPDRKYDMIFGVNILMHIEDITQIYADFTALSKNWVETEYNSKIESVLGFHCFNHKYEFPNIFRFNEKRAIMWQ